MDIARAQQFLRDHENAVLATWRRDGRLHMSPVTVGLDGAGRAIISSQETTYKVRNLRRDPRAALCVFVHPDAAQNVCLVTGGGIDLGFGNARIVGEISAPYFGPG